MLDKYIENEGIVVQDYEDACAIAKILLKNGNVVMISAEEDLFIVNWVWCDSGYANRNDVVFRNKYSFEVEFEIAEEE